MVFQTYIWVSVNFDIGGDVLVLQLSVNIGQKDIAFLDSSCSDCLQNKREIHLHTHTQRYVPKIAQHQDGFKTEIENSTVYTHL